MLEDYELWEKYYVIFSSYTRKFASVNSYEHLKQLLRQDAELADVMLEELKKRFD